MLIIHSSGGKKEMGEPDSRMGFNFERVEGKIYLWNGYSTSPGCFNEIHRDSEKQIMHVYDIVKQSWHSIKTQGDKIKAYSGSGVCSVGHRIYVFGGYASVFSNTNSVFDTLSLKWKKLNDSGKKPFPRDKLAMLSHEKSFYIFGGWSYAFSDLQPGASFHNDLKGSGAGWNNEFYKYDTETNVWSYVQFSGPLPEPRAASSFIKIDNDRALLFGGRTQLKRVSDVYLLNISTNTWNLIIKPLSPLEPWPDERCLFLTHLVSNPTSPNPKVVGFWGMDNNNKIINDYWLLDCQSMKWTSIGHSISNQPVPRLWSRSCSFFNTRTKTAEIYVFGGCQGSLVGPERMYSDTVPGMIHMEFGLKKLEYLCVEFIVNRIEKIDQFMYEKIPPHLINLISSKLH
ncbi:Kelch domain-containing protein 2-like [Oopsacas minuta]|uniref:Kelch domain-containing protein 2-like n=1 Tax=Oopsacas minuta TaxID=111878 RepID=A0AAV7K099_9METZ|nr:Kelch domain-containing protein 2-like [Oopsacas minuta]